MKSSWLASTESRPDFRPVQLRKESSTIAHSQQHRQLPAISLSGILEADKFREDRAHWRNNSQTTQCFAARRSAQSYSHTRLGESLGCRRLRSCAVLPPVQPDMKGDTASSVFPPMSYPCKEFNSVETKSDVSQEHVNVSKIKD